MCRRLPGKDCEASARSSLREQTAWPGPADAIPGHGRPREAGISAGPASDPQSSACAGFDDSEERSFTAVFNKDCTAEARSSSPALAGVALDLDEAVRGKSSFQQDDAVDSLVIQEPLIPRIVSLRKSCHRLPRLRCSGKDELFARPSRRRGQM